MNRRRLKGVSQSLALFLTLAIGLPNPALALRNLEFQENKKERSVLEDRLLGASAKTPQRGRRIGVYTGLKEEVPAQAGAEEVDPQVKQLVSEFVAQTEPAQRLSLLAGRLPRFNSQQRIEFFYSLPWLESSVIGQLLVGAFLDDTLTAHGVQDQILQAIREDGTGNALLVLETLLTNFPEDKRLQFDATLRGILITDPRWATISTGSLISASMAMLEALIRRVEAKAQNEPSDPEPYKMMAELFLAKASGYRHFGNVVLSNLANIEMNYYALSSMIAAELLLRRGMQEGEQPSLPLALELQRQRLAGELEARKSYQDLRRARDAVLTIRPSPILALQTLEEVARLEELYGTYLTLSPTLSGEEALDHLNQAQDFRRQRLQLIREKQQALGASRPTGGGLEEGMQEIILVGENADSIRQISKIVESALQKLGVHTLEEAREVIKAALEGRKLYRGLAPGVAVNIPAYERTVGTGVYLVEEEKEARHYALVRAGEQGTVQSAYFAGRLLDLTKTGQLPEDLALQWRAVLSSMLQPGMPHNYFSRIDSGLSASREGRPLQEVVSGFSAQFSRFLQDKGYDGLRVWEGGETVIGEGGTISAKDHVTVLVFDPKRVIPDAPERLAQLSETERRALDAALLGDLKEEVPAQAGAEEGVTLKDGTRVPSEVADRVMKAIDALFQVSIAVGSAEYAIAAFELVRKAWDPIYQWDEIKGTSDDRILGMLKHPGLVEENGEISPEVRSVILNAVQVEEGGSDLWFESPLLELGNSPVAPDSKLKLLDRYFESSGIRKKEPQNQRSSSPSLGELGISHLPFPSSGLEGNTKPVPSTEWTRTGPSPAAGGLEEGKEPVAAAAQNRLEGLLPGFRDRVQSPSEAQEVQPVRLLVDTSQGDSRVLRLAELAVRLRMARLNFPIEAAGVATAQELEAAALELPDEVSRDLLRSRIFVYEPGNDASHRAALQLARSFPGFADVKPITAVNEKTIQDFLAKMKAVGVAVESFSPEFLERIRSFLTSRYAA